MRHGNHTHGLSEENLNKKKKKENQKGQQHH